MRWLVYMRLFHFHVKRIPGNKDGGADALSRRRQGSKDPPDNENEANDYFDAKLYSIHEIYYNIDPTQLKLTRGQDLFRSSYKQIINNTTC